MSLLSVANLTKSYGGLVANNDISFKVEKGQILSVIGPNGAGKSTLFKLIAGFVKPTAGKVVFQDEDITGLAPHVIAERGVVRTFQETTIFKEMSALHNVVIAHHLRCHATALGIFFGSRRAREDEHRFRESAADILEFLGLGKVMQERAGSLPHGHLRALGIAMGLATNPTVLLLDEPFAGMNPEETDTAVDMVRKIVQRGVTVVLVEHDMRAVMRLSDRIVVISFGSKIAEGTPDEIQRNEKVIEAYLGREDDELGALMYFELRNVNVAYDKVLALRDVSVKLDRGDVVALIGSNGAGKTTTMRAITRLVKPRAGEIWFDGERIDTMTPDQIVRRGISMVPEGRHVYPYMSVKDNLLMGAHLRRDAQAVRSDLDKLYARFPRLKERLTQQAGSLSGGEQQMVAIGRALMARPRMLLLDEPSLGLAPMVVRQIAQAIVSINREDQVTVILVEQNSRMALKISRYAYVLENGRVALEGASSELLHDDHVRRLYLGV